MLELVSSERLLPLYPLLPLVGFLLQRTLLRLRGR